MDYFTGFMLVMCGLPCLAFMVAFVGLVVNDIISKEEKEEY